MKILYVLLIAISTFLTGCLGKNTQSSSTNSFPLRQMGSATEKYENGSGRFFLLSGSYNNIGGERVKLRAIAEFNQGYYQFIDIDLDKVIFTLDSNVNKPWIVARYDYSSHDESCYNGTCCNVPNSIQRYIGMSRDRTGLVYPHIISYRITCHPKYLPENIGSIDVTK